MKQMFFVLIFLTSSLVGMENNQQEVVFKQLSGADIYMKFNTGTFSPYDGLDDERNTFLHLLAKDLEMQKIKEIIMWYPIMPKNNNHLTPLELANKNILSLPAHKKDALMAKITKLKEIIDERALEHTSTIQLFKREKYLWQDDPDNHKKVTIIYKAISQNHLELALELLKIWQTKIDSNTAQVYALQLDQLYNIALLIPEGNSNKAPLLHAIKKLASIDDWCVIS